MPSVYRYFGFGPDTEPKLSAMNPQVPQWALSLLDFRAHAVDPRGDHPLGVFVAFCGHRLLMCDLHEEPPGGLCFECSQAVVARRTGGRPERWVQAAGDVRCHAAEPGEIDRVATTGEGVTRCGSTLLRDDLQPAQRPWSPLCSRCVVGFARDLADPATTTA